MKIRREIAARWSHETHNPNIVACIDRLGADPTGPEQPDTFRGTIYGRENNVLHVIHDGETYDNTIELLDRWIRNNVCKIKPVTYLEQYSIELADGTLAIVQDAFTDSETPNRPLLYRTPEAATVAARALGGRAVLLVTSNDCHNGEIDAALGAAYANADPT